MKRGQKSCVFAPILKQAFPGGILSMLEWLSKNEKTEHFRGNMLFLFYLFTTQMLEMPLLSAEKSS